MSRLVLPARRRIITRTKMRSLMPNQAVNLQHPLAQGLVSWWRVGRTGYGTNTWYDLMGQNHATLTNMDVHGATSGWHATTRPGGDGEVRFDGSNDYGLIPHVAGNAFDLATATPRSMAWWMVQGSGLVDVNILSKQQNSGSYIGWGVNIRNISGFVSYFLYNNGLSFQVTWPSGYKDGILRHFAYTYSGSGTAAGVRGYVNGQSVSLTTIIDTLAGASTSNAVGFEISGRGDGAANWWNGTLDDILWYPNVVLSASQVATLYQSSLLGHPGLLKRRSTRYYSFSPAAAGGSGVVVTPSQIQYQAQTPRITLGVVATPARIQVQALAARLGRGLLATPAQVQYQAQVCQITRGLLVTPSRSQTQAQLARLTVTLRSLLSQAQYQAQTPALTRTVVVTPSRSVSQAQTPIVTAAGSVVTVTPGRSQYQAQTPVVAAAGSLVSVTPSRSQYQAQVPHITVGVVATPSRASEQVSTPILTRTIVVTPSRSEYQAEPPQLGRVVTVHPGRSVYQAATPVVTIAGARTIDGTPSRIQYQAQTPQMTIGLVVTPSRAEAQAPVPILTRTVVATPSQSEAQAQTPVVQRSVTTQPGRSQYQAVVPHITMTLVAVPSRSQMQAGTPALGRTVIIQQGQGQYQAITPLTSRTALIMPSQGMYRTPAPMAGMDTMGQVSGIPSRSQYLAMTPSAALEAPVVYYSKQADGVFIPIQTTHMPVVLRL